MDEVPSIAFGSLRRKKEYNPLVLVLYLPFELTNWQSSPYDDVGSEPSRSDKTTFLKPLLAHFIIMQNHFYLSTPKLEVSLETWHLC
jgi:hypothetical protein